MKKKASKHPDSVPNSGSEQIPPGATTRAADRPLNPGGGAPGSGAGPRHAANDVGSPDEEYGATDSNDPLAEPPVPEPDPLEEGPPYAGHSGGAVGGTPAEGRAVGGEMDHGIAPEDTHRGDSTLGSITSKDPATPKKRAGKRKKE